MKLKRSGIISMSQKANINKIQENLRLPSPWEQHETFWSKEAGIELWIKRDDLIHPLISGNKWRKLSGILSSHNDYNKICTFGGAYSNHLLATAVAAHLARIPAVGYIRGEKPKIASTVLELCSYYGMILNFVSRSSYDKMKLKTGVSDSCLFIAEGGYSEAGMKGVGAILHESNDRMDYYMLACGTATTLAGLVEAYSESETQFIGVSALKGGEFLNDNLKDLTQANNYKILTDYHFGGYAKINADLLEFVNEFAKETHILLDPIYTSKCFFAAKDLAQKGYFERGIKLGLIHTGGLTGWYGKWPEILEQKKT